MFEHSARLKALEAENERLKTRILLLTLQKQVIEKTIRNLKEMTLK